MKKVPNDEKSWKIEKVGNDKIWKSWKQMKKMEIGAQTSSSEPRLQV